MSEGIVYKCEDWLIWIIPSFSILNHENHSEIKRSKVFKFPEIAPCPILIRAIRVIRTENIPEEWIGLMVVSRGEMEPTFKSVRFGYVDEEKGKTVSYIGEWIEHSDNCKYFRVLKFVNKREYKLSEVVPEFGYFRFWNKGYLFATRHIQQNDSLANAYTQRENDLEKLSQNLKELYVGGKNTDAVIKVKDREFKVHKVILTARSSVFDAMFTHGFSENNTGIVPIEDCEPDIFEEFLFFVYTGTVQQLSSENVCELYYVADKYLIPELKEECIRFLKKSLSIEIICDVICLSTKCRETELLDLAIRFFTMNMEEILITVKWQLFLKENPIEANELTVKALKLGFTKKKF